MAGAFCGILYISPRCFHGLSLGLYLLSGIGFCFVGELRGSSSTNISGADLSRSTMDLGQSTTDLGRIAGVSRDQLDQLRQDVRSGLSDALFTRLCNMEEVRWLN